jgi:hypothetical protein
MPLQIGFAGTFYTLWHVMTEPTYETSLDGRHYQTGNKTTFTYYQNLSKDLSEAQKKAAAKGCKNLTPDLGLKGEKYFERYERFEREPEQVIPEDCFQFGKYKGQNLREVNDLKYLIWYAVNSDSKIAQTIAAEESSDYCIYKGEFMTVDAKRSLQNYSKIEKAFKTVGYFDALCEKNQNHDAVFICGARFDSCNEVKEFDYQGYEYFLPVIDGKAKRVKGKLLRYFAEFDPEWKVYIVTKIELL